MKLSLLNSRNLFILFVILLFVAALLRFIPPAKQDLIQTDTSQITNSAAQLANVFLDPKINLIAEPAGRVSPSRLKKAL